MRQGPAAAGFELKIFDQQDRDQCGPQLDIHGVGAGPHERLDTLILFAGLEEQFDLPALLVDSGDGRRRRMMRGIASCSRVQ
jgi:hypothetical protein